MWAPLGGRALLVGPLPSLPSSMFPSSPVSSTSPYSHILSHVPLPSAPGSTGRWSSTGCSTELRAKRTICRCNHLTFFALLLVTAHPLPDPSSSGGNKISWQGPRPLGCVRPGLQLMGSRLGGVTHRGRSWTRPPCKPSFAFPGLAVEPL